MIAVVARTMAGTVMNLLESIENTGFATFIRESPSLFGYTLVLSLHAIGLSIVAGVSSIIALRLLGVSPGIPLRPVLKLFPLMYTAFWINALSGLALLSANATGMLTMPMFYIKMAFIALAVLSLRMLRTKVFSEEMLARMDGSTVDSAAVPAVARNVAIMVLCCWLGAIVAGRFTAYPYFVAMWFGI